MADTDCIEMSWIVAARPKEVYDHWMGSEGHAAMTGGGAEIDARVGGRFTAWDGYIEGRPGKGLVSNDLCIIASRGIGDSDITNYDACGTCWSHVVSCVVACYDIHFGYSHSSCARSGGHGGAGRRADSG